MPFHQPIVNLNGGEFSPFMDARIDLAKYGTGSQVLENFIVSPYGAIIRRPGTEFMGRAKFADKQCILYGFNFSTTTTFLLEIGDQYTRFWSNGFQVKVSTAPAWATAIAYADRAFVNQGGAFYMSTRAHTSGVFATDLAAGRWVAQDIYEIWSAYTEGQLHDLQFQPINDIIYVVHPEHYVVKYTRLADDNWTFGAVGWTYPPVLTENVENITLTPSGTGGDITLTASAPTFKFEHIGSHWAISHFRSGNQHTYSEIALGAASGVQADLWVVGSWELTTYGTWQGELRLDRRTMYPVAMTNYEAIRTYNNNTLGQRNITAHGEESEWTLMRLVFTGVGVAGTNGIARLEVGDGKFTGTVAITGYTSPTVVSAHVIRPLWSTNATNSWAEAAFSVYQGFPRAVCWHNLRLIFGGTKRKPLSIHGSQIDDFENFRQGSNPDNAISFTISSRESSPIQWMLSQKKAIIIGTASGEGSMQGTDDAEALSPTNVEFVNQSAHGSAHIQSLLVNEVIIFVQRQARKLREFAFDFTKDQYVGPDLTVLASHIAGPGSHIIRACFQQQPDATVWCPISSGDYIAAMVYEREQNVVGWARHTTPGVFEDAATVFGGAESDEVWFVVKRVVNGETVRYIERLHPSHRAEVEREDKLNWWYLDCGIRRTFATAMTTVSGLDHLEGMTVTPMVDGAVQPDRVVTGGQITLEFPGTNILIGLRYRSTSKPSKFNLNTPNGSAIGRPARVHKATFRIYKSLGMEFSVDGNRWTTVTFRKDGDQMDASPPAFTGDKNLALDGVYRPTGELSFRDGGPYPLNILAVIPEYDFHGP